MAKLYFRYGTMDSAKTLNLLAVAHNYRKQGKVVKLLKPKLDTRFGEVEIASRAGISQSADVLIDAESEILPEHYADVHCILVDEAQFLQPAHIEMLRRITFAPGVPVICYGLRTDFQTKLFPGSKRLLELADRIEEVKVTCQFCNRKAVFNLRYGENGKGLTSGPQVALGDENYAPVCWPHYEERTS